MAKKLPAGVYYTRRCGGLYVSWDGTPKGEVRVCFDRKTACGDGDGQYEWVTTPHQGGSCRLTRVLTLAANYFEGLID